MSLLNYFSKAESKDDNNGITVCRLDGSEAIVGVVFRGEKVP
jgi:hypothetical protein